MYQPYRKKSYNKDKLKPFVSETHIQNNESYFFSVEKMELIDLDKPKQRSNTIIINPLGDEKTPKRREKGNSIARDMMIAKEKLNLNRVLSMHQ